MKQSHALENAVAEITSELQECSRKLFRIMPEYFFVTVRDDVLAKLLPCITQLRPGSPALEQRIGGKLYRMFLASSDDVHVYNLASLPSFRGALIHQSTLPFVSENGRNCHLVMEVFTSDTEKPGAPRCPFAAIKACAGETGGPASAAALKALYGRLNWSQVEDLTPDRLCERMTLALEVEGRACPAVRITPHPDGWRMLVLAQNAGSGASYFNRIVEALYGKDVSDMEYVIARNGLKKSIGEMPAFKIMAIWSQNMDNSRFVSSFPVGLLMMSSVMFLLL